MVFDLCRFVYGVYIHFENNIMVDVQHVVDLTKKKISKLPRLIDNRLSVKHVNEQTRRKNVKRD